MTAVALLSVLSRHGSGRQALLSLPLSTSTSYRYAVRDLAVLEAT